MSLCYPKQEDKQFLEELKDQPAPTPSDEEELAERFNVLNQATSSSGGKSSEIQVSECSMSMYSLFPLSHILVQ